MITLKYWNNLTPECRVRIGKKVYGSDYGKLIREEYHHCFDYNGTGEFIKEILGHCYLRGNELEIRCFITPEFKPTMPAKNIKPTSRMEPTPHKYYFRMYTESDSEDGENIWEEAYSENEARDKAYDDFHSITRLDLIRVQ